MKLFKKIRTIFKRKPNIFMLILAVLGATALWFFVSVRERIEAQLELALDYQNVPPNLIVTDGLVSKITVRVRGPETLIRTIPREMRRKSIDLSGIKKGDNSIPLNSKLLLPEFRAFELIDVQPTKIDIIADNLIERNARVTATVESPLSGDALTIEKVSVKPGNVILKGPEKALENYSVIPVKIRADAKSSIGTQINKIISLDTPSLITANPSQVEVSYTVTSGRTVVTRQCPIIVAGDSSHAYETDPAELTMRVEVPDALAKDNNYLKQLTVTVVPPDMTTGQSLRLRPRYNFPEGMSLATIPDREITVTKVGK